MNVPVGTVPSPETPAPPSPNPPNPEPTPSPSSAPELDEKEQPKSLIEPEAKPEVVEFVPLTAADITFPEDLEVNEILRDEALAIVNNRELSPKEQLQGLIDLQAKLANEASETISKTWENTQKTWQDEVKADPTIGGDKLTTTLSAVNKLVTEYGTDELVKVFALTGAGNNVHVIKFLHNVAGKLLEGGVVSATSPSNQEEDAASRLFPNMNKG